MRQSLRHFETIASAATENFSSSFINYSAGKHHSTYNGSRSGGGTMYIVVLDSPGREDQPTSIWKLRQGFVVE